MARMKDGRPKVYIDGEFTASAAHLVVHSLFRVDDHPTLNKVLEKCREKIGRRPHPERGAYWLGQTKDYSARWLQVWLSPGLR